MNDFGYFQNDGEYVIHNWNLPRPWMNYLWNHRFLSAVNQFGGGDGAYGGRTACYIDEENRGRSSLIRNGNRYFYIRDQETGDYWCPGWYPAKRDIENYSCVQGIGYSIITGARGGIQAMARVFVDTLHPCEIWSITIQNLGKESRNVSLYSFVEFSLEGYERYSEYDSYVRADYDQDSNMIYARNSAQERPHDWFDGFIVSDQKPAGYDTSKKDFLGNYGSIFNPETIIKGYCNNKNCACEDMAGVFEHRLKLQPNEKRQIQIVIGAANDRETAKKITEEIFRTGIPQLFAHMKKTIAPTMNSVQIQTNEKRLDELMNFWTKRQVMLCAEAGRSTGKGFRDTLQDAMAVAILNPKLAKSKILETLAHQYRDGRCVRGWLPVDPHIYSDGPVWIAPSVNSYIKETGDFNILENSVPYLDQGTGTVWEHILTAARYSANDLGQHGLVLAHDGDWNDSLNGIGLHGKGESVWTSIALYGALGDTIEIAERFYPNPDLIAELEAYRKKIKLAVNTAGWDQNWYLAGYDDDGNPVGCAAETEGRIYLNSQTWAVMTGIADDDKKKLCLQAIDQFLTSPYGPLTLYPPYTQYRPQIGRLTGFIPGIWENGTPYCHGGMFKAAADFSCGRTEEGWNTFRAIMPDNSQNPSTHSGCEPYAFTNMYFGPANPRAGETSFAWVTGTAGWAFRTVLQYMFGFRPDYDTFHIIPCLPAGLHHCHMRRCFRGTWYQITYQREDQIDGIEIWMDGKKSESTKLPIYQDEKLHDMKVLIGNVRHI